MYLLNVVLFEPEIAGNTGNIIRLCANTYCQLHLIKPLGFELDDKRMRRAGLDYHEYVNMQIYESWDDFLEKNPEARLFALTTKTNVAHTTPSYQRNDYFIFGPESRGLPGDIREYCYQRVRIPMSETSRSMNLSNSVAIMVFEALRQLDFPQMV